MPVVVAVVMVMFPVDSELLQALDLCENDPVAVARCFVMKVRNGPISRTQNKNIKSNTAGVYSSDVQSFKLKEYFSFSGRFHSDHFL